MNKLWVDDVRPAPDKTWVAVDTVWDATLFLRAQQWDLVSLDHDMGDFDDTKGIVLMWCEGRAEWPSEVRVHSANPVGRQWLEGMIERYGPEGTLKRW